MNRIHDIKGILARLKSIGSDYRNEFGVCFLIHGYRFNPRREILDQIFSRWPEATDNPTYPVPGYGFEEEFNETAHSSICAQEAFESASSEEMWSDDHPYGAARRRLLGFAITELDTSESMKRPS